jgi:hypothetical protein
VQGGVCSSGLRSGTGRCGAPIFALHVRRAACLEPSARMHALHHSCRPRGAASSTNDSTVHTTQLICKVQTNQMFTRLNKDICIYSGGDHMQRWLLAPRSLGLDLSVAGVSVPGPRIPRRAGAHHQRVLRCCGPRGGGSNVPYRPSTAGQGKPATHHPRLDAVAWKTTIHDRSSLLCDDASYKGLVWLSGLDIG